jgi:hypothetical protein
MARRSNIGETIGGLITLVAIVYAISSAISDHFHISGFVAFLILVGIYLAIVGVVKAIEAVSAAAKRHKPCSHGVPRGKDGGCKDCIAEDELREAERRASQAAYERLKKIKKEATALRAAQLRELTNKWLSKPDLYLQMTPQRFEDAVAALFRELGYEVKQTPYSNDRGKDAIAVKDGKKYLIECKRYAADGQIGRRDLQIFFAAMKEENAEAGFYINTGRFAKTAIEYAAKNQIELYDAKRFQILVNTAFPVIEEISSAKVMCLECGDVIAVVIGELPTTGFCANGHGVTNDITVQRLMTAPYTRLPSMSGPPKLSDALCERCHAEMRVVNGRRGKFWGCSEYPRCRFTRPYIRS